MNAYGNQLRDDVSPTNSQIGSKRLKVQKKKERGERAAAAAGSHGLPITMPVQVQVPVQVPMQVQVPVPVPVQAPGTGGQQGLVPVVPAVPPVTVPINGVPPVQDVPVPDLPVTGSVDADALASAMLNVSLNGATSGASVTAAETDGGFGVRVDPLATAAPLPNSLPADGEEAE